MVTATPGDVVLIRFVRAHRDARSGQPRVVRRRRRLTPARAGGRRRGIDRGVPVGAGGRPVRAGTGPVGAGARSRYRILRVAEGQLQAARQRLAVAADVDLVILARRRPDPDLADPAAPGSVGRVLRLGVVQPLGRLALVTDDETERLGPFAGCLQLRDLLGVPADDRVQAAYVGGVPAGPLPPETQ